MEENVNVWYFVFFYLSILSELFYFHFHRSPKRVFWKWRFERFYD